MSRWKFGQRRAMMRLNNICSDTLLRTPSVFSCYCKPSAANEAIASAKEAITQLSPVQEITLRAVWNTHLIPSPQLRKASGDRKQSVVTDRSAQPLGNHYSHEKERRLNERSTASRRLRPLSTRPTAIPATVSASPPTVPDPVSGYAGVARRWQRCEARCGASYRHYGHC